MYCDTRLLGVEKWYHTAPKDANMRIPDTIKKTVCFLCVKHDNGNYQSYGTGFLVGVHREDWDFLYFVTAKHLLDSAGVFDEVAEEKPRRFEKLYLRLNKHGGEVGYVELDNTKWLRYATKPFDVAAIGVSISPNHFNYEALFIDNLATDETIQNHNIGLGDDLFIVGLFTKRKGRSQNIPILRTGIIAAMPDETFLDEFGDEYNAYLAEVRSIGGLSGSPVFVYFDKYRTVNPNLPDDQDWKYALIGIIRGHWELEEEQKDTSFIMDSPSALNEGEKLNTGIAKVTPSQYILAMLNHPKEEQNRQNWIREQAKKDDETLDRSPFISDGPFGADDFQNALKKATRRISPPDRETKETSE